MQGGFTSLVAATSVTCMNRRWGVRFLALGALLVASGCSSPSVTPEECREQARALRARMTEMARMADSDGGVIMTAREERRINRPIGCL